ncbi:hypothetical protein ACFWY9_04585 [Amycolatopsis sp. NPDC059027]|uniref:hypothetical protein n=1 Tax=Amycolatopsis sp. NPDC059027 TaxID=3346709 RepID=UPI00366EEA04
MSWQDELRRLDAELAAGRLGQAEHRRLRDDLLAEASGRTVPSPVASPLRHPGNTWHSTNPAAPPPEARPWPPAPVHQQPPSQPTPAQPHPSQPTPAQQPPSQPTPAQPGLTRPVPAQSVPPMTMPLRSSGHNGMAYSTDRPTTAPSPADVNPTQYLRVDGTPAQVRPDTSPLPSRFPPLVPEPVDAGNENRWDDEPATPERSRKLPTWLFLAAGVLLVLALIIGGTWWLGRPTGTDTASSTAPTGTNANAATGSSIEDRLPVLPGTPNPNNSTMSVAKGLETGLYPNQTADTLTKNGASEVIFRGSADGQSSYLLLVIPTSGPTGAKAVVDTLLQNAVAGGFTQVPSEQLKIVTGFDGKSTLKTTWYASGGTVVYFGAGYPKTSDSPEITARQDRILDAVKKVLPPG